MFSNLTLNSKLNSVNWDKVNISVDVSTSDKDYDSRIFAKVIETQKENNGTVTLLCEKTSSNEKSLWHSKKEMPDLERPIVFKTYKHNLAYPCVSVYYGFEDGDTKEDVKRKGVKPCDDWAYVDEIVEFYERLR